MLSRLHRLSLSLSLSTATSLQLTALRDYYYKFILLGLLASGVAQTVTIAPCVQNDTRRRQGWAATRNAIFEEIWRIASEEVVL